MNQKVSDCLRGRENNFDFMRFMAALFVIFHHSFYLSPSIHEPLLTFTNEHYHIGSICVAIFFIISGFLITRSFDRSRDFLEYVTSRVLRIYPALIIVVFCTVFIIGPLLTTSSLYDYFTDYTTFKYYYSNTFSVTVQYVLPGVFEHNYEARSVNSSLWTLGYELFGYCLVATIGCFVYKKKRMGILLTLFTLVVFRNKILHGSDGNLRTLLFFLWGALIYIYRNKVVLNDKIALVAFCLLVINMRYNSSYIIGMIITSITLSYVTIYLCFVKTKRLKNFAKYGDFSYGVYIWGFLVQQTVNLYFPQLSTLAFFLVSASITLVLAMLSWHFIEKRALMLKNNLKYQQAIARRSAQLKERLISITPALLLRRLG